MRTAKRSCSCRHGSWRSRSGRQAEVICAGTGLRAVAVYGGVGYGPQIDALKNGAQLVIGTPGRVLDLLLRGTFSLDKLQMRVFDEADRMLSMGFYPDMQEVQRHLPARTLNTLHNSMFSATFPSFVLRTAKEFMRNPEFLSVSGDQIHVTDTTHVFYPGATAMDKDRSLIRIIEIENPASAIIFCNTKAAVHYVTVVLQTIRIRRRRAQRRSLADRPGTDPQAGPGGHAEVSGGD